MRIEIQGVPNFPRWFRKDWGRRAALPAGPPYDYRARSSQILAALFVPAGYVAQVAHVQAAPFRVQQNPFAVGMDDSPLWWEELGPMGPGATLPFWRWSVVAQINNQEGGDPDPPVAGQLLPIPGAIPGMASADDFLNGVAEHVIPWQSITRWQTGGYTGNARIYVQGPRHVVLISTWDQTARLAAMPIVDLLGQGYGILEGELIPDVLLTPRAMQTRVD